MMVRDLFRTELLTSLRGDSVFRLFFFLDYIKVLCDELRMLKI